MLWTIFVILLVLWTLGTGHFLHPGWVHPHPVGVGRRCSCNQSRSRPKSCLVEVT